MYLVVGKGTFDKESLLKHLIEWRFQNPDSVIDDLDKKGNYIFGKYRMFKFK